MKITNADEFVLGIIIGVCIGVAFLALCILY